MIMTDAEIRYDYEHAESKKQMITILADQNLCKPSEMAQYLLGLGYDVDKRMLPKPMPNNKKKKAEVAVEDPDQSIKADAGKPRLTLVPMQIMFDVAEVREYGNRKYPEGGKDNWKNVEPERYREAAFRHFLKYIDDPFGVDPESGILHRKHLECNLAFLAELEAHLCKED